MSQDCAICGSGIHPTYKCHYRRRWAELKAEHEFWSARPGCYGKPMIQKLKGNVPSYTVEAAYGKTWSEISFVSDLYEFSGAFRYPVPYEFYLGISPFSLMYYDAQTSPPNGPRLILQRIQRETVTFTQTGTVRPGEIVPAHTYYCSDAGSPDYHQMFYTTVGFNTDRTTKIYRRSVTSVPA